MTPHYMTLCEALEAFIIALANTKGGAGKTATGIHLGAALAARGQRTLLIDVDPAHSLTRYFEVPNTGITTSEVLLGRATLADAMVEVRPNLFICPSNEGLGELRAKLTEESAPEVRLSRAVRKIKKEFAFALVDCPGSWDILTRNAIFACDAALYPINSEADAFVQAGKTIDKSRVLAELHERELATWPLITFYREFEVPRLVAALSKEEFGDTLLTTRIRRAEMVNKSGISHETFSDMTPSAAGGVGADYNDLADEIIARRGALV